ncbi:MAG TPA: UDP-N-acetylmuramoyl-L-alanine--D-glutamate ligase [Acidimicrobiales bacterium]|nr:UDP-N-acetylmuramoyl-L-alanine--D-glutamate ligase [Acidimicrobiales bacterium]
MSRLTGFADLAGKRVGIFGYGVEGRATRRRVQGMAKDVVLVDDASGVDPDVIASHEGGLQALLECDVVLKSPGIPRRRADVLNLEAHGVTVTSALNLWLHDVDRSRVVAITGTKGKSTTTALMTFFLRCLGETAVGLGNFGQPPYDPDVDVSHGWLVLEVSSFQCVDIDVAPSLVIVTSLGADHLDWHGTLEDYRRDKLSLTRATGEHRTLVPDTTTFHDQADEIGGEVSFIAPDETGLAAALGLLGAHSNSNVALALHGVARLTQRSVEEVRSRVLASASAFEPLRGRLTLVVSESVDGVIRRYVDDGLATSALPAVAALEVFRDDPVALIAGGFDRGVDYAPLAEAIAARTTLTVLIITGEAGRRIGEAVARRSSDVPRIEVSSMHDAVTEARRALDDGGVVLLSPAAPSFDQYKNWEERSEDFTRVVHELTGE